MRPHGRFPIGALLLLVTTILDAAPLRIYYTANRQGEFEPCGCQTGQIGGIERLFNFLSAERVPAAARLFLDSGDAFFSLPDSPEPRQAADRERARLVARAHRAVGVTAYVPGRRDFAAGWEFLGELASESGAAFLLTNFAGDKARGSFLRESLVISRGGKKIGLIGLAAPDEFSDVPGMALRSPAKTLKEWTAKLRADGADIVIVLSYLGLDGDRELARIGGADLIFGSKSLDVLTTPERVGKTWIFQSDVEGRQVGALDYLPERGGGVRHRLVELTRRYDGKNPLTEEIARYQKAIRSLAFSPAKQSTTEASVSDTAFVAHPTACRTCHEPQYEFWKKTNHASAYLVLFAKNQHFNPECIGCHSLGFGEAGGFRRIARPIVLTEEGTPKKGEAFVESLMNVAFGPEKNKGPLDSRLQPKRYAEIKKRYHEAVDELEKAGKIKRIHIGVQCEHCHGNRNGHPAKPASARGSVKEASCRQCHMGQHDPSFDFAKKKPLVACPSMGKGE